MKQFIVDRHTTPSTPTLEQVPTEKVPIYDTIADAESDLSNLEVGQIVKTKDAGLVANLNPIDEVKAGNYLPVSSNAVAESLSYSTTEQKTGGKWIDGKDIYRKCIPITLPNESGDWFNITGVNPPSNIDQHIKVWGFSNTTNGFTQTMPGAYGLEFSAYYHLYRSYTRSGGDGWLILEYTKNE